ncbi:hypothetical protein [Methylobacterium haplocladii]|uniref:Uncharacterized protein n=1 Tax=Methylobacterium haplocladii TaxID=1176176 RepID=A0A512IQR4_9HYPH|nr:hypothetical protein [Methylobacterium haplocladii]GEP00040.1 hypothetical protein MHA02_24270 [Methylobacterium haplocladii]GJD85754.1 hypothetical protein HPGCJGGD_3646 [Methylobacterium haplocladii]GLS59858.1 hypothetical protein GCM10007887_25310 [Methylobacterium haplocladii]
MPKTVTVTLSTPIEGHGAPITQLVFRPPVWRDILPVGEPFTVHRSADGVYFYADNAEAFSHYLETCLVEPAEYSLVESQVGPADTIKAKEVIRDFFIPAAPEGGGSTTSQTSSSSSAAGSPPV